MLLNDSEARQLLLKTVSPASPRRDVCSDDAEAATLRLESHAPDCADCADCECATVPYHGWYGPEGPLHGEKVVVIIPVVAQRPIPMVLPTMVIPQLQFFAKVIDDPVVRVVQVLPSRSPVVCNDRCPGYVPQLQLSNKAVYTPVVAQSLIPMVFLFNRPSRFPCCRTHGGRCPCCVGRASW